MLKMSTKLLQIIAVFLLVYIRVSAASSIISTGTPGPVLAPAPDLGNVSEFISSSTTNLTLSNDGLIILDQSIENMSLDFNIDISTSVYRAITELPDSIVLPNLDNIANTFTVSGDLILSGVSIDFILMRDFNNFSSLSLSSSVGVLILDSTSLSSVPVPGSILMLFSGLFSLFIPVWGRTTLKV